MHAWSYTKVVVLRTWGFDRNDGYWLARSSKVNQVRTTTISSRFSESLSGGPRHTFPGVRAGMHYSIDGTATEYRRHKQSIGTPVVHPSVFCCSALHPPDGQVYSSQAIRRLPREMTARSDKRWLKSVADPDLVGFFEDSEFDAAEYAKSFYEQREASHAANRYDDVPHSNYQCGVDVSLFLCVPVVACASYASPYKSRFGLRYLELFARPSRSFFLGASLFAAII